MATYKIERGRRPGLPIGRISLIAVVLLLLLSARSIASYAIEIAWWKELGQFHTWLSMLYYSLAPVAAATLLAFGVLWMAHARALKFAGTGLRRAPPLRAHLHAGAAAARLPDRGRRPSTPGPWCASPARAACRPRPPPGTTRSSASRSPSICSTCRSTCMLRGYVLALVIVCILVYWMAARGWQLRYQLPGPARGRASSTPASSGWKAAWNRASCAAPRWCCCWPWRCGSSWAATKWSTTSTASSWWASITWTRTSACRCNGC